MNIHERALHIAASLTLVFVAIITIWTELSEDLHTFLTKVAGHHWVTKGIFAISVFVLFYFVLQKVITSKEVSYKTILTAVILSGIAIVGFFVIHYIS